MEDVPDGFDGHALLVDIEDAGLEYWLSTKGSEDLFVTKTDILQFENAISAFRRALDAMIYIRNQPIFFGALWGGLERTEFDAVADALWPRFFADPDDILNIEADEPARLKSLLWELAALVLAGEHGRMLLEKQCAAAPNIKAEMQLGPSTPWERLIASALPVVFERHLKRPCRLWVGATGSSTGTRFVQVALERLGYEAPSEEGIRKIAQRYRRALRRQGKGDDRT